jgi:hypothetical protein
MLVQIKSGGAVDFPDVTTNMNAGQLREKALESGATEQEIESASTKGVKRVSFTTAELEAVVADVEATPNLESQSTVPAAD